MHLLDPIGFGSDHMEVVVGGPLNGSDMGWSGISRFLMGLLVRSPSDGVRREALELQREFLFRIRERRCTSLSRSQVPLLHAGMRSCMVCATPPQEFAASSTLGRCGLHQDLGHRWIGLYLYLYFIT